MTRAERQRLDPVPLPEGWEWGPARGQWLHKEMVAAVHATAGEFVCSADEQWIDGTFPTFDAAAAKALSLSSQTWSDLRRERDEA